MSFRDKLREGWDEGYGTDNDVGAKRILFFLGLCAAFAIITMVALR